jgi:glyoxylase-like metal-dependent hydrolase (beta-lactamase superfamily II)
MITSLDEAVAIAEEALADDAPSYEVLAVRYGTRMATRGTVYVDDGRLGDPDAPLQMDYFFWLLLGEAGTILVDCGFHPDVGARRGRDTLVRPLDALDRLGVDRAALERIVVTHLHYDHVGQLDAFPNAELIVQRRDVDFWAAPGLSEEHAVHVEASEVAHVAKAVEAGRVQLLDGAAMLAPGVGAILIGGHSPGQQSLVVKGELCPVLLASDAVHYYEELEQRLPFAILVDLDEMVRGYETLQALSEQTGAVLAPGHDPEVTSRFPSVGGNLLPGIAVRLA